ncbi:MAG: hypothetical protein ACR2RF_15090, partial [Geminicoccaceae bacterium]
MSADVGVASANRPAVLPNVMPALGGAELGGTSQLRNAEPSKPKVPGPVKPHVAAREGTTLPKNIRQINGLGYDTRTQPSKFHSLLIGYRPVSGLGQMSPQVEVDNSNALNQLKGERHKDLPPPQLLEARMQRDHSGWHEHTKNLAQKGEANESKVRETCELVDDVVRDETARLLNGLDKGHKQLGKLGPVLKTDYLTDKDRDLLHDQEARKAFKAAVKADPHTSKDMRSESGRLFKRELQLQGKLKALSEHR